jgi:hypothetical protein
MKIDEEVPIMMPKMIARAKPRITSPPINASGSIERTTVSDVATVRQDRRCYDAGEATVHKRDGGAVGNEAKGAQ